MFIFFLFAFGIYFFVAGGMYLFQDRLIFMPSSAMIQTPEEAGLKAQEHWIETEDGFRLHSWLLPNHDADFLVIFSHGNSGNISGRLGLASLIQDAGYSVLLYDYRGFGLSEGRPGEEQFYKDITSVINYITAEKNIPEQQIIMYGRSLGGAVAAYGASRHKVGALVLDSAFQNLKSVIRDQYPFIPPLLSTYSFPTDQFLKEATPLPVMFLHSPDDRIIYFHHSEKLYNSSPQPKTFIEMSGGHNDNFIVSRPVVEAAWTNFRHSLHTMKPEQTTNRGFQQ